jgi:hypothetical protein
MRASALTLGDRLLREDGEPVALAAILPGSAGEVMQVSLAGPHHLYLSEGLWSHNKATPPPWSWPPAGSIP